MEERSIVLVATGSSGSIILPAYLGALQQELPGCRVTVVMTETAQRFVAPEVVGWFAAEVIIPTTPGVNPIEVALAAEAVVVLPASGNTVAAAALGLMPTQATTVLAAHPGLCLWFPHMHQVVWERATTRQYVATLRDRGDTVVEPEPVEGYQISERASSVNLSMPVPDKAALLVREWLETASSTAATARAKR